MSRIAKSSIKIPEGTSCNFDNNILTVKRLFSKMHDTPSGIFMLFFAILDIY